jgi:hypothetical protein
MHPLRSMGVRLMNVLSIFWGVHLQVVVPTLQGKFWLVLIAAFA